ncbi:MAG: hypothetical protein AAGI01_11040 [Myxococcota bacterium]
MDTSADTVWLLVDHSSRALAMAAVADELQAKGVHVEIVTITEVLGTMARTAIAGGAERLLRGLRVAVQGQSGDEDLIGAVKRARPDVLVITDAKNVRALHVLERLTGIPTLQVGVLPDFNLNEMWMTSGLHAFVVPHEELAGRLVRSGVDPERVLVAGPAVGRGFASKLDAEKIREEFGFSTGQTLLLVRADTFSLDTLGKLVFQAKLVEGDVQFIFHHNGDSGVASSLRRAASEYGLHAIMFGRVEDLERYVALADAVVVSPAEPLMAEIIAQGTPVVMVGPSGGAAAQVAFLEDHRMGRHVPDLLRLGAELERFISPESLEAYTERARSIGLPGGSAEVAEALLGALERAEAWRIPAGSGYTAPSGGDDGGAGDDTARDDGPAGPFETIGSGGSASSGAATRGGFGAGTAAGGGGPEGARRDETQDFVGISQAEAKEQLAQLILAEREAERKLGEIEKEQQRWRGRLDLAREWNEADLAEEAEGILRGYLEEARPLQQELEDVRRQKAKLKAAASGGKTSGAGSAGGTGGADGRGVGAGRMAELERRFRRMEDDRALGDLKDRIDREMGD